MHILSNAGAKTKKKPGDHPGFLILPQSGNIT